MLLYEYILQSHKRYILRFALLSWDWGIGNLCWLEFITGVKRATIDRGTNDDRTCYVGFSLTGLVTGKLETGNNGRT